MGPWHGEPTQEGEMRPRAGKAVALLRRLARAALALGLVLVLGWILSQRSLPAIQRHLPGLLGEGGKFDAAQDYLGAQALIGGGDAYPGATEQAQIMGWKYVPITYAGRSTHPPTAFIFFLGLAGLTYERALSVWMWTMVATMVAAARLMAGRRYWLLLSAALLLWPPGVWSLGQLTPIWLLGVAAAWRWRRHRWAAGIALGLAALPKYLAAISLAPFLLRRRYRVVIAFAGLWLLALLTLVALRPTIWQEYWVVNRVESPATIGRLDNGALLVVAGRASPVALVAAVSLLLAVVASGLLSEDETQIWLTSIWLSVAALPLAWNYSLLPLAPVLLAGLRDRYARFPAALAVVAGAVPHLPAGRPPAVALSIVLTGLALCVMWAGRRGRAPRSLAA